MKGRVLYFMEIFWLTVFGKAAIQVHFFVKRTQNNITIYIGLYRGIFKQILVGVKMEWRKIARNSQ